MTKTTKTDFLFSYGSLLSSFSRQHHSQIAGKVTPAYIRGWSRHWCARYQDENATYAGTRKDAHGSVGGVLFPVEITEELKYRERQYRFEKVSPSDFTLLSPGTVSVDSCTYWICESVNPLPASAKNPLPQSYVDTCLMGCLEVGDDRFVRHFIESTKGWGQHWVNDRAFHEPVFPRRTPITQEDAEAIDTLLEQCGVLRYRQ